MSRANENSVLVAIIIAMASAEPVEIGTKCTTLENVEVASYLASHLY